MASSNNPRFFIPNANATIGVGGFVDLVVMFDCDALPPQQGMVTVLLNGATTNQMLTIDVNLAAGGMQSRTLRARTVATPRRR